MVNRSNALWISIIALAILFFLSRHMVTFRSMSNEMLVDRKLSRSNYAEIKSVTGEYWYLRRMLYREYICVYTVYSWTGDEYFELARDQYGRRAIRLGDNEPWAGDWSRPPLIERRKKRSGVKPILLH